DSYLQSRVLELAETLKLRRVIKLVQSTLADVPMVIGVFRPVLILPACLLTGLTPTQCDAILAHELAHIRRYDFLLNLMQVVIETLLFYHPAIWWLSRRIRLEREFCCDDIAAQFSGHHLALAEGLAVIEASRLEQNVAPLAMTALGNKKPGVTYRRIKRILNPASTTKRGYPMKTIGSLFILTILLITAAGSYRHANAVADPDDKVKVSVTEDSANGFEHHDMIASDPFIPFSQPKQVGIDSPPAKAAPKSQGNPFGLKQPFGAKSIPSFPSRFEIRRKPESWELSQRYDAKWLRTWFATHDTLPDPITVPAIQGTVVGSNGTNVAGAVIQTYTPGEQVTLTNKGVRDPNANRPVLSSDPNGKFKIAERTDPYRLLITHQSGVALLTHEELINNQGKVYLLPWAKIEGTFIAGSTVQANKKIKLYFDTSPWSYSDVSFLEPTKKPGQLQQVFVTTTDERGHFTIENVPPLRGRIYVSHKDGFNTNGMPFSCEPGNTSSIKLGKGRSIKGRFRLIEEKTKIDWTKMQLILAPYIDPPPYPREVLIRSEAEVEAWLEEWSKTKPGQAYAKKMKQLPDLTTMIYPGEIDQDGLFTVHGVSPGKYMAFVRTKSTETICPTYITIDSATGPLMDLGMLYLESFNARTPVPPAESDPPPSEVSVNPKKPDPTPATPANKPLPDGKPNRKIVQMDSRLGRLDGLKPTPQAIRVHLKLDRQEFFLGESIAVEYEMKNIGNKIAPYDKGGFYTGFRTNSEFPMTAVQIDDAGKPIGKPVALFEQPQDMGGMVSNWKLKPGESHSTVLFVTRVLRFSQPGRYRLQIKNVHAGTTVAYSSGETIITLKQPTTKQARSVYEQKKLAPRKSWDDNKSTFLKDAADFTTMYQPVYLPVLAEFLSQGDDEALLSLGKMENMEASRVLVKSIEKALDRDDWQAARNCFQHMKQSLPFPNWYYDSAKVYSKKDRDRVARSWEAGFCPVFIRLAHRLTKAIASPANPTKPRGKLTQKEGQAVLRDIDYIYKCIGEDKDFEEILNAFAISIELTKTLPFETHQYFRPRGSAYGFRGTIDRLIESGVKIPAKPRHTGEAAALVMALYLHQPSGWQSEVMKWLKGDSPYLSELILERLPDPISADVLEYLPTALSHDYIDLQIAACKLAQRYPRTDYKAPLKKILMTATDKYLIEFAVDAARANGLKVK
ncbi:MAG: M56 family metallopeptidase, partial [Planctomycetaceae bacterium]|nr:M56 family metallopeptidase [Planctomycetaceae bacterium]